MSDHIYHIYFIGKQQFFVMKRIWSLSLSCILLLVLFKKKRIIIKHWKIQNRKEEFLNVKKRDKHVEAFWERIGIP